MKVKLLLNVWIDGCPTETDELLTFKQLLQQLDGPSVSIKIVEAERIPSDDPY